MGINEVAAYYCIDGKFYNGDKFERAVTETTGEIFSILKKRIREKTDISPELAKIGKDGLPSPKYRESVCKYLSSFFKTNSWPRPDIIDYSDFKGYKRPFPPREPEEDTYTEYEMLLGFHESYRNGYITEYDLELGFIFAVNEYGFHLQMLGSERDTIAFYFRGKNCFRGFAFNPGRCDYDKNPRTSWNMRVVPSDEKPQSLLKGSYRVVMLLSSLLKSTKKKPINIDDRDLKKISVDSSDICFSWELREELHNKITNDNFIMPKKTVLDDATLEGYIERIRNFGYEVKTVKTEIKELDSNGNPVGNGREIREYYIPPFICKRDAELIVRAVNASTLPYGKKHMLVLKFISESGCRRYSKDELEESELPSASKKDWKDNDYALIVYTAVRAYARPITVTSTTKNEKKRKDNLLDLIIEHYGAPRDRKSIMYNINSMVAVGLPIKKEGNKYAFDTSRIMSGEELSLLEDCILGSADLGADEKARLTDKLKAKFKNPLI